MSKRVPITPELLEKNGFTLIHAGAFIEVTKGHYMDYIIHVYFRKKIYFEIEAFLQETTISMPMKYMGELQQALFLCKINRKLII